MLTLFKKKKIDIEAFITDSYEGLKLVMDAHRKKWNLGEEKSWKVDEREGRIIVSFMDGTVASAPAQIVGTLNVKDATFQWGWEHAAVVPSMQEHAALVKAFGIKHRASELTTQIIPCTEKRAWELTALATLLAEANGAYRVQARPDTYVFMTFGEVSLSKHK
ncbi:MAG: DUF6882 domain-containing protein [Burkholderiaceae bacterium]